MAARKGGLNMGKGLQSLIPTTKTAEPEPKKEEMKAPEEKPVAAEPDEKDIIEVKITMVIPNAEQPRKEFDEAALAELAESIKLFGVLQPLLVQKSGKYYEIIAGERRWRAAKLAGLKKIPVIVREYTKKEIMEISLIENLQREDLNPIEEAAAFKRLIDEFEMTQTDVAKRVSKSRTAITNSMRLLKLDERVQKMLVDGQLSAGHARALLPLEENELQFEAAVKIVSEALSVRETEKLVQKLKKAAQKGKKPEEDTSQADAIYSSIEEQLKEILGSKVLIRRKANGKGAIEIEYYSPAELDRILDMLHKIREEGN